MHHHDHQHHCSTKSPVSACALSMAMGVTWSVGMLALGMMAWLGGGWGGALVTTLSSLYIGFQATGVGSIIGAVWGFVDGFVTGLILAWIYNFVLCHCRCKRCCGDKSKHCCGNDKACNMESKSGG